MIHGAQDHILKIAIVVQQIAYLLDSRAAKILYYQHGGLTIVYLLAKSHQVLLTAEIIVSG